MRLVISSGRRVGRLAPLLARATGLAVCLAVSPAGAAAAGADCVAIEDPLARLQCYDRAHGRGTDAAAAPAASPAPAPPTRRVERAETPVGDRDDEQIVATVIAVSTAPNRRQRYQLDNGQVWEQMTVGRSAIAVGDRVQVVRSRFGSFHIRPADGGGRSVQVRQRSDGA